MAIIRTQLVSGQRRIITKVVNGERRVSCSCCPSEEGCCMYPADQLGVGYTAEDLPDEIMYIINVQGEQRLAWPKVGDKYVRQFCDDEECYEAEIRVEGGQWLFGFDNNVPPAYWFGSNCLFQEGDEQGFKDNFADTYTVTTNQATGVVTRRSLCSWTGIDSLGCDLELLYETLLVPPRSGTRFKWTIDFAEGGLTPCAERAIAVKTPHQNTPVGSYDYEGVSVA
jgi:hypothetical protein